MDPVFCVGRLVVHKRQWIILVLMNPCFKCKFCNRFWLVVLHNGVLQHFLCAESFWSPETADSEWRRSYFFVQPRKWRWPEMEKNVEPHSCLGRLNVHERQWTIVILITACIYTHVSRLVLTCVFLWRWFLTVFYLRRVVGLPKLQIRLKMFTFF